VTLAVEVLSAGGLLEAGQLRHDAIRRAVLRSLDIKDREALHGRAASVLYDHGADATAVACHLVAEPDGVAPWAVFILQDAAEEALVGDDVNLAIRYLRTAYQVCANEQQRMAIRTRLIYAEWRVNPAVALRDLPLLAAAALDHRLELRDAVELIGYLLWFGLEGQAVDVLAAIERRCADRSELEPEIEERLQLAQIWLGCMHNHLPTQLNMPSEKGCSWIRSTPLRAVKLLRKIVAGEGDDEVLSEAEKILQGARLDTETVMPFTVAIASLAYVKELDKAADWSDSLLREAAGRSAPMWEAWFSAICATISFHRGRLTEADDFAKRAFDLASPKSWGVTVGLPIACLLLAMTAMNRYEEAAAYAEIPVPDAMFQTVWGPYYLHARGRYYLATGRYHAALDDFENCREMMSAWNFDLPALVPWRVDIALAWSGLGQFRQARELMRNQLARLRSSDLHLRGICLRTLATASDLHERPAPLREAASLLERCGDLFELCLTIAELSRTYQALGHESLARVLARRARRLARACGADPCDVLGSSVPPGWTKAEAQDSTTSSPVAKLSEAELRVAALAAQGYTNREVADRLFITVSTVEQHLTRVYRKLVVRRRSDLPIELLRANGAPQATPP
jgi:DNA-binding CsgD family transcriptional regulator